jgi:hypothetical protein
MVRKGRGELTSFLKYCILMDSRVGISLKVLGFARLWMCFQELKQAMNRQDEKKLFLWKKGERMLVRRKVEAGPIWYI